MQTGPAGRETEEQRRRRVASRIRNALVARVVEDLAELARQRAVPDEWMDAGRINDLLERRGYWVNHPDAMAAFLSPEACEEVVERALRCCVETHSELWAHDGREFKPAGRDWNAYASRKADLIRREHPNVERTALYTGADGASVLFGCDDYANDPRARREVSLVREFLARSGIPELGFGVSGDGRTWVMVVWSRDESALSKALFDAWQTAFSGADQSPP